MNRGITALASAALIAFWLGGCQDGYPIAPSHCDRFCHAIERSDCGQDPVNCVLACEQEQTVAPAGCEAEIDALLVCVDALPTDQLPCSPNSFWLGGADFRCTPQVTLLQTCRASTSGAAP